MLAKGMDFNLEYKIPLFDLSFGQDELNAVADAIKSNWISMGDKTSLFEDAFSELLSVKRSLALTNCTTALHLALKITGIGVGDEVIVPSLTFVASVNAIRYCGATPVFCDISGYDDLNISPQEVLKLITPRTKAVMVVHIAGFPCAMDEIMEIARRERLVVIEDACHGPLSEYKGNKLGTIGDVGCFSFYSNKNISTGEGGMLITNDEKMYEKAKLMRSHGMTSVSFDRARGHCTSYDVVELGYNYRIDDMRSALGLVQLGKLKNDLIVRAQKRSLYMSLLGDLDKLFIPFRDNEFFVSNYILPVVLKDSTAEKRDAVRDYLADYGIQTSVHYPAVHRFGIYSGLNAVLPKTEYVSDCEITLPMYSKLKDDEIEFICAKLEDALCSTKK
jgi:dTDP-4-amino-4,6-dideoxygalactose transaminase